MWTSPTLSDKGKNMDGILFGYRVIQMFGHLAGGTFPTLPGINFAVTGEWK